MPMLGNRAATTVRRSPCQWSVSASNSMLNPLSTPAFTSAIASSEVAGLGQLGLQEDVVAVLVQRQPAAARACDAPGRVVL